MKLSLIVAVDENWGIGKDNDLMWHLPNDMKFFKDTTENEIVLMGRRNYDSIPEKYRPLSNRLNCILTHSKHFQAEGCMVFHTLQDVITAFKKDSRKLFIIGGGEIYKLALEQLPIDELYITKVHHTFDADTYFPKIEPTDWFVEEIAKQEKDAKHAYSYTIYKYSR